MVMFALTAPFSFEPLDGRCHTVAVSLDIRMMVLPVSAKTEIGE
jgi:hypothetical protein